MRYLCAFLCLLVSASLPATEVGDVAFPDRVTMTGGQALVLNGAGMRKKFFIGIYAAALYLPERASDADAILAADRPWQVTMQFVYDEVSRDKIVAGWTDGFRANLDDARLSALEAEIEAFNALFEDVAHGDVYRFSYHPAEGTEVRFNGEVRGLIPGRPFMQALLSVWLGEHPADKGLKRAMLGD